MGFFDLFNSTPAKSSTKCECDVCSKEINLEDGYLLTTKDIITKRAYWEYAFTHQWDYVHNLYGSTSDDSVKKLFLVNLIIDRANQETPWALCESCSNLFAFDKKTAKRYAQKNICPLNTGHADFEGARLATVALMDAWEKIYHEKLPDLTREIRV